MTEPAGRSTEGKALRVLQAPIGALYQTELFARGLREYGMRTDVMYFQDFSVYSVAAPDAIVLGKGDFLSTPRVDFLLHALEAYDVFHFHSGYTLLPWNYFAGDLRLLKKLGKVVCMSRWGCRDGHTPSEFRAHRDLCDLCTAYGRSCTDATIGRRLRIEQEYVDVIINHEPDFDGYNRPARFVPGCLDLEFWSPNLRIPMKLRYPPKAPSETRILHAVGGQGRGDVKGSQVVTRAADDLRRSGLRIDYRQLSDIPVADLRFHVLQADIVIDQLRYGSFGSFAREAMALGRPVVGHVRQEQRLHLPGLPIVEAGIDDLEEVLAGLIRDPNRLGELGAESRRYAVEHFDYRSVTGRLIQIYEEAAGALARKKEKGASR